MRVFPNSLLLADASTLINAVTIVCNFSLLLFSGAFDPLKCYFIDINGKRWVFNRFQPLYYFSCLKAAMQETRVVERYRRRMRWKRAHSDSYVFLSPSLCPLFVCRLPCLMEAVVLLCLTGSDSTVRCNLTVDTPVCVGCVWVSPPAAVYITRSLHLGLSAVFTLSSVLINTSTACRNNSR